MLSKLYRTLPRGSAMRRCFHQLYSLYVDLKQSCFIYLTLLQTQSLIKAHTLYVDFCYINSKTVGGCRTFAEAGSLKKYIIII